MKKLLIFGAASSPHLLSWALPFKNKYKVIILTFHPPANVADYNGIEIHHLKPVTGTKLDFLLLINHVQKFIDTFQPDVIHAHYASSYGLISAALKTSALKVLTVWGSDINHARKNFVHRFLIDRSLLKFNWINVPSDDLKKTLMSIGVDEKKLLVFQYGTDLDFCDSLKGIKKENDEITILSSRLWAPLYNIDKVVGAFKVAYEKNAKLKLILSGSGSPEDNQKINQLIGTHPAIRSLGFIPKSELVKLLWEADIYISIPESDGLSLSVLEALYCECFPIFSDIPPNREILNYCEGTIVKSLEINELSDVILETAKNCKNKDLSKNVNFIDSRANYKKNMDRIDKIYLKEKSV